MSDANQHATQDQGQAADSAPADEGFGSSGSSQGTATKTRQRVRPRPAPPRVDRLPPWRVILHNDDVNEMGYVVETIIELMRVNPRVALLHTLTAHQRGLALLVTTHREHAELLHDQFKCKRLTVSIEPEG